MMTTAGRPPAPLPGRIASSPGPHARFRPFAQRNHKPFRTVQADLMVEDVVVDLFDLFEQSVVDPAHGDRGGQGRPVLLGQAFGGAPVIVARPLAFAPPALDE